MVHPEIKLMNKTGEEETMNKKRIFLPLVLQLAFVICQAQTGSLGTESVVVQREFEATITDAEKISENPQVYDSVPATPKLKYGIQSKRFNTDFDPEPITPVTIKGEPLVKLYHHYAKVGFGNYQTPYFEYFYNTLRSKTYSVGAHAKHHSSSGDIKNIGFAGFSENILGVHGKLLQDNYNLYSELNYSRNVIHYYGYNTVEFDTILDKNRTTQRFSFIQPKVSLESNHKDSTKMNYRGDMSFYNLSDNFLAYENVLAAHVDLNKFVGTELFGGDINIDYYNNKVSNDTTEGLILGLSPYVALSQRNLQAKVGARLFIEAENSALYHFYPDADVRYQLVPEVLSVYAIANGRTYRNTYKSITDVNPFVQSVIPLRNSHEKINLRGGFTGRMSSNLSYDVGVGLNKTDQRILFVTASNNLLQNKFTAVYDNVKTFSVYGELGYQVKEKLNILAKAKYFDYSLDIEEKAWNLPDLEIGLGASYNLGDKILLRTDVFYYGKRYANVPNILPDNVDGITEYTVDLPAFTDVNMGVEYRYNKKLGAFINLNNLAGIRYYRWNNYPSQRFNFLVGLNYSF